MNIFYMPKNFAFFETGGYSDKSKIWIKYYIEVMRNTQYLNETITLVRFLCIFITTFNDGRHKIFYKAEYGMKLL